MEAKSIFCIYCGKKLFFEPEQPPAFCLYCGKKVVLPGADAAQRQAAPVGTPSANPAMVLNHHERRLHELPPEARRELFKSENQLFAPKQDVPKRPQVEFMEFTFSDYQPPESNSEFCDKNGTPLLTGWLPEGFVPLGDTQPNENDIDRPLEIAASAKDSSGKFWFSRKYKTYHIDKMSQKPQPEFLQYDDYLDREALSWFGNVPIRLVFRVPATEEELKTEYDTLVSMKKDIESVQNPDLTPVVQSGYGEIGGKLYEAEKDGKKQYVFLHAYMLAMEYGYFNQSSNQSSAAISSMVQMIQASVGAAFGGGTQSGGQRMPQIDTDRSMPCGTHRTDGLITNTISWTIEEYSGMVSDTMPTREEIRDFLRFVYSLKVTPQCEQEIKALQQKLIQMKATENQMLANTLMQGAAACQAEFDRHNAVMHGIRSDMDAIQQQHITNQNAAFDRSVQRGHELAMGVNTYERTDGTRIEADVSIDKVFQHQNNPNLLVGTPSTVDPPVDWIELEKLK